MNEITIRKATINDAYDIEYVGAQSWYESYSDYMPKEYLENRIKTVKEKIPRAQKYLQNKDTYYVAIFDNKVIGILDFEISSNEQFSNYGHLISLYVLKEFQNLGVGKLLFKKAIEELINMGINDMYLECIDNGPATGFYKKYDGQIINRINYPISSFSVPANIFIFNDLKTILKTIEKNTNYSI